jgi:hypothetical protein
MKDDNLEKILELLKEVSEIYPEIDKVVMDDELNPNYIILATTEFVNNMADIFGEIAEFEEMDVEDDSLSKKRKLQ